jgi:hypothetical protein
MPTPEFAKIVHERYKVIAEMAEMGCPRFYPVNGTLSSMLDSLLPYASNKKLLVQHGGWTAYMGGDIETDASYLGEKLKIRVVSVHMIQDVPNGQPGSAAFMMADNRSGGEPKIRALQAMKDSKWEWVDYGEAFPFEQVEKYSARRIKDRLTFEMIGEYCLNFGIHLFDPDFYGAGYVVEEDPTPRARVFTSFQI